MARVACRRSSSPKVLDRRSSSLYSRDPIPTVRKIPFSPCLLPSLLLAFFAFVCLIFTAMAQTTDVNDVHVQPREVEKPKEAPKPDPVSTTNGLSARVRPLKVDVDLVLVPVTITDPMNRLVTGLEKENFQLFEGNASQQIRTFSSEDAPVSLGVIFDSAAA